MQPWERTGVKKGGIWFGGVEGEQGACVYYGERLEGAVSARAPGIRVRGPRVRCSVSVQVQLHALPRASGFNRVKNRVPSPDRGITSFFCFCSFLFLFSNEEEDRAYRRVFLFEKNLFLVRARDGTRLTEGSTEDPRLVR